MLQQPQDFIPGERKLHRHYTITALSQPEAIKVCNRNVLLLPLWWKGAGWGLGLNWNHGFEQIVSNNMRSKDSDEKFPWKGAKWLFGQLLLLAKCFNLKLGEVAQGKFFAWHPDNGWWLAASFQFFPQNINFFQRRLNGSKTQENRAHDIIQLVSPVILGVSFVHTPFIRKPTFGVENILHFVYFFVLCLLFFRLSPGVLFLYYFHFKVLWKFEADIWIMDDGEQPNFSLPTKLQRNERRRWGTGKWKWKWKEMRNREWKWRTIKINLTTKMFIKRRAGEKKGNQIWSRDCVKLKEY